MKTYRIIECKNGWRTWYIIQRKMLFWWLTLADSWDYDIKYKTYEEAKGELAKMTMPRTSKIIGEYIKSK
jgi:hypothetical protein